MAAKLQNRIKQLLYRPNKKNPHIEFFTKKLEDAEKALNATIGGALKKKKRRRR